MIKRTKNNELQFITRYSLFITRLTTIINNPSITIRNNILLPLNKDPNGMFLPGVIVDIFQ